jgi:hypothetical protein
MKTFVTLLTILLAMVFVVPAFAGEEPYKSSVWNDWSIPSFHISPKVKQFTHFEHNTNYYGGCDDVLFPPDPRIDSDCEPFGAAFLCPSACRESFKATASAVDQPEVCCAQKFAIPVSETTPPDLEFCPDKEPWGKTVLTSAGNAGVYEWVIGLPKKPEGEINIEMQCGVLKPNSWAFAQYDAINICAAVTGEPVGPNCTRITGAPLIPLALPRLEVWAHPGCNSPNWEPFRMTAYKNPGTYAISRSGGQIVNNAATQVLDGGKLARIALKACLEKTVIMKWPKEGEVNAKGDTEHALQAGDLIKVKMIVPPGTVDLYCGKYSVTLGGIGEPNTILDDENCDCISDADCKW